MHKLSCIFGSISFWINLYYYYQSCNWLYFFSCWHESIIIVELVVRDSWQAKKQDGKRGETKDQKHHFWCHTPTWCVNYSVITCSSHKVRCILAEIVFIYFVIAFTDLPTERWPPFNSTRSHSGVYTVHTAYRHRNHDSISTLLTCILMYTYKCQLIWYGELAIERYSLA